MALAAMAVSPACTIKAVASIGHPLSSSFSWGSGEQASTPSIAKTQISLSSLPKNKFEEMELAGLPHPWLTVFWI